MARGGSGLVEQGETLTAPAVTAAPAASLARRPTSIGSYKVIAALGEGNMGQVYRCLDPALDRVVAVKLIAPAKTSDPESLKRFEREARTAAKVDHVNVVRVYGVGNSPDGPFLVMEFVNGTSLEERIDHAGYLELREALRITRLAAEGLAAACRAGVVHRDVKPSNILLTHDGGVKVADFGLAKPVSGELTLTSESMVVGTPNYMAPEQAEGRQVDHRADIYALGITLFHMLTGRPPFSGGSPVSIVMQHIQAPLPDLSERVPGISRSAVEVVRRMTAKDPSQRYATWDDALKAIAAAGGEARGARPRTVSLPARHDWISWKNLGLIAVTVLALAGAWLRVRSEREADEQFAAAAAHPALTPPSLRPPNEEGAGASEASPVPSLELPARRDFALNSRQALADWHVGGVFGGPPPASPLRLERGRLDVAPRVRATLWNSAVLSGDVRATVRFTLDRLARGNHLFFMLRYADSDVKLLGSVGFGSGGGPGLANGAMGPDNRLVLLKGRPVPLAEDHQVIVVPGREMEVSLVRAQGRLMLVSAGKVMLAADLPESPDVNFGVGFPEGGAYLASVALEASRIN